MTLVLAGKDLESGRGATVVPNAERPVDSDRTVDPQVGDVVCDCFYRHLRIVWIDEENDQIELEDGSYHSLPFCCDPPDHTFDAKR